MDRIGSTTGIWGRWKPHLRGHLLRFDLPPLPALSPAAGLRLLLLAVGLEILRISLIRALAPPLPLWILVPLFVTAAVVLVPRVSGVPLSQLGLRPWSAWTITEKSYFLQVTLLAAGLLLLGFIAQTGSVPARMQRVGAVFVPYLFFGFYQELIYRGLLQTELVRRWGVWMGIVAANLLFTFGPLHANHYGARAELAVPMFASIFLIGLFFGVLYRRSGNLWIVGCFHAIGNAAIVWRLGAPP